MVMRNVPFATAFGHKHGEARRPCPRLAVRRPAELVKAGNDRRVVAEHNSVPFLDGILVATSLRGREIF